MLYTFHRDDYFGVHKLEAPYALLTKAFGNDGTVSPRDDYKSMSEWDIDTPDGKVEIYDYKIGTCHSPHGLAREDITVYSVQGPILAIERVLKVIRDAC